jgi:hypothetical protein
MLSLVGNYYTDQRLIKIAGDNGAWQIDSFRGSDLNGNTQVRVQTGSAFPQSTAAKQAALTDLLRMMAQMGVPMDPKMLGQFLQDWEIGGADRLVEMFTKSEQQVNRENMRLSRGIAIPINDYDDDQEHIDGHEDYQRGSHYQQLDPGTQRIFELHVAAHRERLAQQQQQELQMQMQMQNPQQAQAGQAQMQMDIQGAQQQQQGVAQQQGFDAASAEQQQRQAEEEHRQRIQHRDEEHRTNMARLQAQMQREAEQHEQRLQLQRQQAQQQRSQGPQQRKAA